MEKSITTPTMDKSLILIPFTNGATSVRLCGRRHLLLAAIRVTVPKVGWEKSILLLASDHFSLFAIIKSLVCSC